MKKNIYKILIVLTFLFLNSLAVLADKNEDIVDKATKDKNLTTLVTAIKAAGLVDTLKGQGPFTVFAPTDEAFKKLPEGTLDSLLKDKNSLIKVLTYHVILGEKLSKDISSGSVKTVQGQDLTIEKNKEGVFVNNDSKVITPDIKASNGIIHEIDTVLIPK